jgi:hypothetical protein
LGYDEESACSKPNYMMKIILQTILHHPIGFSLARTLASLILKMENIVRRFF